MKKYLWLLIPIFFGCGVTSNICPSPTTVTVYDTVKTTKTIYDTIVKQTTIPIYDTITNTVINTKIVYDTLLQALNIDTANYVINLNPDPSGDSYNELQSAINFQQITGGYKIHLNAGTFFISKPLLVVNFLNGQYQQSYINIEGASNAKNPIQGQISEIAPLFDSGFAIGMQQCKSCSIKNIFIQGKYTLPNSFTQIQIDTLAYNQWQDGIHSFNRSSPYAGIVVDPFSDPINYDSVNNKEYPGMSQYYISGMNQSGSTAINISGCFVQDFVVGICITPSHQLNAEMINVTDSHLDNNCIDYAFTQAQSKVNLVTDLETWGQVYCMFDGSRFGINGGDGSICPMIDEVNIAGFVHEFISDYSNSFPVTIKRVYAEGLFRFGALQSAFGAHLDDCQIDFGISQIGAPSPGIFYNGNNTIFTNCMFRVYDGSSLYNRLPFWGSSYDFIGGSFGGPPVMGQLGGYGPGSAFNSHFSDVLFPYYNDGSFYYGTDTFNILTQLGNFAIRANKSNFNGYLIGYTGTTLPVGTILVTTLTTDDVIPTLVNDYGVGYVTSISNDTIYLTHMGYQIKDSTVYNITAVLYSQSLLNNL